MFLKSIEVSLAAWGDHEGRYVGRAVFESPLGKVEINLPPDTSEKVLKLLAEQLVFAAQEAATMMVSDVITGGIAERKQVGA